MNVQFSTHEATQAVHLDRVSVLVSLSALRQEWDQAVDGVSLINIPASVGLLLFDVTARLGLTREEQTQVLGHQLQVKHFSNLSRIDIGTKFG